LTLLVVLSLITIGLHTREGNRARARHSVLHHLLGGFIALEDALHRSAVEAPEWRGVIAALAAVRPAAHRLRRQARLLGFHDYGIFFEVVNALTLWELRILPHADGLLERKKDLLAKAAGALGEAEALVALALPLAERPDFALPEVVAGEEPVLEATELGHPLIAPEAAVRNPLSLGRAMRVLVVTGANMAGKSTYLKSVGVNLILASIGGPVCARGFRFTPLDLHADINVRDSLADGKSYFQVEVERVRRALEAAARSPRVLAVFDELFRGTNSEERTAIARSVVRFLASTGALAIVATHDLQLTTLAAGPGSDGAAIQNRHFRETVEEGRMRFDYRLREGPAPTRNAIRVLEASGYPETIVSEARRELAAREAAGPEGA
jgi:DNA mismatch repair ATPase MutS